MAVDASDNGKKSSAFLVGIAGIHVFLSSVAISAFLTAPFPGSFNGWERLHYVLPVVATIALLLISRYSTTYSIGFSFYFVSALVAVFIGIGPVVFYRWPVSAVLSLCIAIPVTVIATDVFRRMASRLSGGI
jgi:hypothetical protein